MNGHDVKMKAKALVSLIPKGSQVFLVALLLLAGSCFAVAFYFNWHGKEFGLPLVVGIVVLLVAVGLWFRSQMDVDNPKLPLATFNAVDGSSSTELSLYSGQGLSRNDKIDLLVQAISLAQSRTRLPEPDGLIDSQGRPISNSQDEAKERVDTANNLVEAIRNGIYSSSRLSENDTEIEQPLSREQGIEEVARQGSTANLARDEE